MNIGLWLKVAPTLLHLIGMLATAIATRNFTVLGSQGAVQDWTTLFETFGLGAGGAASMIAGLLAELFKNGRIKGAFDGLQNRLQTLEAGQGGLFAPATDDEPTAQRIAVSLPGFSIAVDVQALGSANAAARQRIVSAVQSVLSIPIPDVAEGPK